MLQKDLIRVTFHHPLVNCTLFARKNGSGCVVVTVAFGVHKKVDGFFMPESNDPRLREYAAMIKGLLNGKIRSLDAISLDTAWCTTFQKKVLLSARKIPWGSVISYGELAENAGYPKAIRAAASVMRNNRFPLVIPCHRVIGKGGRIGGFMGATTGSAVALKKKLLRREGIVLD
jgi:methylated-DNA-[protein]-cysteine S-methyltransferase